MATQYNLFWEIRYIYNYNIIIHNYIRHAIYILLFILNNSHLLLNLLSDVNKREY